MQIESPPPLAKGRRKRSNVASIERIALQLFAERGFEAVTVEQIANASGISRRTFFRYFGSKEDILLGDQRHFEDALAATLEEESSEPVLEILRRRMIDLATETAADLEITRLRLQLFEQSPRTMAAAAAQMRSYRERLTPLLARRLGLDETTDMRPFLIVNALLSSSTIALWHWLATGGLSSLEATVGQALDYALAGFVERS